MLHSRASGDQESSLVLHTTIVETNYSTSASLVFESTILLDIYLCVESESSTVQDLQRVQVAFQHFTHSLETWWGKKIALHCSVFRVQLNPWNGNRLRSMDGGEVLPLNDSVIHGLAPVVSVFPLQLHTHTHTAVAALLVSHKSFFFFSHQVLIRFDSSDFNTCVSAQKWKRRLEPWFFFSPSAPWGNEHPNTNICFLFFFTKNKNKFQLACVFRRLDALFRLLLFRFLFLLPHSPPLS